MTVPASVRDRRQAPGAYRVHERDLDPADITHLEPAGYVAAEAVGVRPILVGAGAFGLATTLLPVAVPGVAWLSSRQPGDDEPHLGGAIAGPSGELEPVVAEATPATCGT